MAVLGLGNVGSEVVRIIDDSAADLCARVGAPLVVRGIGVLKGTPEPVIAKLEAALIQSMNSEGYLEYLAGSGQDARSIAGREVFGAQFDRMYDGYQAVAKELMGG